MRISRKGVENGSETDTKRHKEPCGKRVIYMEREKERERESSLKVKAALRVEVYCRCRFLHSTHCICYRLLHSCYTLLSVGHNSATLQTPLQHTQHYTRQKYKFNVLLGCPALDIARAGPGGHSEGSETGS